MIVLFVIGLFGLKAGVVVYTIYRFAKWVTAKGDKIKQGYEDRITSLEQEAEELRERNNELLARNKGQRKRWPAAAFSQAQGRA